MSGCNWVFARNFVFPPCLEVLLAVRRRRVGRDWSFLLCDSSSVQRFAATAYLGVSIGSAATAFVVFYPHSLRNVSWILLVVCLCFAFPWCLWAEFSFGFLILQIADGSVHPLVWVSSGFVRRLVWSSPFRGSAGSSQLS
ncbi:hypothetical protein ISN44_As10g020870 [Arabidopsis suecica]|uniref:Uncharacterized protein n=1 Tax=Arabidopsis suecica TaxID=45249 RepID=A0A8T1ZZH3_ARASU|nr:hypothetical protein ISN44_As10g020870 [Arabidopsis suecica]